MSNEIPFFYPKAKRNHKSSWCKTSATRSLLSFLCVIRSFFLSLFCHTLLRATKIHTHAHVPMVNTTKKNTKKISQMKTKKSSRAFLALFATAVFALFPRASHAWVLGLAPVRLGVAPVLRLRRCALFIVNTDTKINLSVTIIKTNDEGGWRGGYCRGGYW